MVKQRPKRRLVPATLSPGNRPKEGRTPRLIRPIQNSVNSLARPLGRGFRSISPIPNRRKLMSPGRVFLEHNVTDAVGKLRASDAV